MSGGLVRTLLLYVLSRELYHLVRAFDCDDQHWLFSVYVAHAAARSLIERR